MEPPFNVLDIIFSVSDPKISNNLSVRFPPFKVFLNLVFK